MFYLPFWPMAGTRWGLWGGRLKTVTAFIHPRIVPHQDLLRPRSKPWMRLKLGGGAGDGETNGVAKNGGRFSQPRIVLRVKTKNAHPRRMAYYFSRKSDYPILICVDINHFYRTSSSDLLRLAHRSFQANHVHLIYYVLPPIHF